LFAAANEIQRTNRILIPAETLLTTNAAESSPQRLIW